MFVVKARLSGEQVREFRIQGIDSENQRVGLVSEIVSISTTP